jgi:D-glycero-alpha-D-manno-heptose-7-phosphate kinase
VVYSKVEEVKKITGIKHKVVRLALLKKKIKNNLEIHYAGDLPSRSGMGSSSSFIVGLLNVLNKLNNIKSDKLSLAKESVNFEQKILKECVGSQDQIACSVGGFNLIKFKKKQEFNIEKINIKKEIINKLNKNLFLIYTGLDRRANDIAKSYIKTLTNKNSGKWP